jgi:hypothetical protein
MNIADDLIADYLRRLETRALSLPPDRRGELLDEIAAHIADARAASPSDDEATVRTLLERLGTPEEIVSAARGDDAQPAAVVRPVGTGLELAAVLMLTAGSFVPVVGWLVGVVLLWASSLWRVREKLLGTLVVPLGPGAVLWGGPFLSPLGRSEVCSVPLPDDGQTATCTVVGPPAWVEPTVAVLLVLAPVVVAAVLMRRARRRAAQAPAQLVPVDAWAASPWEPLELAAVLALGGTVLLLPVVGPLAGAALVVGLVLAWSSPRWSTTVKVVATLLVVIPILNLVVLHIGGFFALPVFLFYALVPAGGLAAAVLLALTGRRTSI